MTVIYEPKGAAREYSPLALNLYQGCSHGCTYCYAPSVLRKTKEQFQKDAIPRKNILDELRKDLMRWDPHDERNILLCFTSDPYQPIEEQEQLTRQALQFMSGKVKNVSVLTKAGKLPPRDYDLLKKNGWSYGATIVLTDDSRRAALEPWAAPIAERLETLKLAKTKGIKTWMSIEPVVDFNAAIELLELSKHVADEVRIGRLNHNAEASCWPWDRFLKKVIAVADDKNINLYIKDELARHGEVPPQYRKRPFDIKTQPTITQKSLFV